MPKLIRTERGWAGHFICANDCRFRRNTLLEYGKRRIVVSTVGNMWIGHKNQEKQESIGAFNRMYETMAFRAEWDSPYWEANVSQQISFSAPWSLEECERETDLAADAMHEKVVAELSRRLRAGERL